MGFVNGAVNRGILMLNRPRTPEGDSDDFLQLCRLENLDYRTRALSVVERGCLKRSPCGQFDWIYRERLLGSREVWSRLSSQFGKRLGERSLEPLCGSREPLFRDGLLLHLNPQSFFEEPHMACFSRSGALPCDLPLVHGFRDGTLESSIL